MEIGVCNECGQSLQHSMKLVLRALEILIDCEFHVVAVSRS